MMRSFSVGTIIVLLALLTAACSRSPRVTFYTLSFDAKVEAAAASVRGPAVSVGPVSLPEMVDRPQLVVRVAANRVDILEAHRWAEPLKSEIPRILARNLGRRLSSYRVSSYREFTAAEPEYRVLMDFTRFESAPGEGVTVEALWTLHHGALGAAKTGHFLVHEKVQGGGYDPLVAAYDRALDLVTAELAKAILSEAAVGK